MMRRFAVVIILVAAVIACQISTISTTFAANSVPKREVAIVIVNKNVEYDRPFFSKRARQIFEKTFKASKNDSVQITFLSGKKIKKKYQEYCAKKGISMSVKPNDQDLIDFASYGGYDKVVYMVEKEVTMDDLGAVKIAGIAFHSYKFVGTWDGILVDDKEVLKTTTSTTEGRYGDETFKGCVKSTSEVFNPYL